MCEGFLDVGVPQRHELIGLRVRQRAKHDRINNREHGCGCARAEAQHENRHERECRALTELAYGQLDGAHHVEVPSTGRLRDEIGARGLKTIGMLRRVALQQGKCGFLERGHRAPPGFITRRPFVKGLGVQVLEIRDELVHRCVGQDQPRLRDAALDFMTEVDRRRHGLRRFDAGHQRERGNETGPVFSLSGQHGAAALGDAVIPPPPLAGLLNPSALD